MSSAAVVIGALSVNLILDCQNMISNVAWYRHLDQVSIKCHESIGRLIDLIVIDVLHTLGFDSRRNASSSFCRYGVPAGIKRMFHGSEVWLVRIRIEPRGLQKSDLEDRIIRNSHQ